MITKTKIKIFEKYNGKIDAWARSASKKENSIINDQDWYEISSYIQDLCMIQKDLTSLEFNNTLIDKLKANCESEEVITQLKNFAKKIQ